MRIDVQKYIFAGPKSSLDTFLEAMQKLGKVQFANRQKRIQELMGNEIYDVFKAIKILFHYEEPSFFPNQEFDKEITIRNPFSFSSEIIRMNNQLEEIETKLKIVESESILSQLFGEVPWDCIHYIESHSNLSVRFFEGSTTRQFDTIVAQLIPIQEISEKSSFISFLPIIESLPSGLREIEREELQFLAKKKKALLEKKISLIEGLKEKSRYRKSLQRSLLKEKNRVRLEETKSLCHFEVDERLFAITGWVPTDGEEDVIQLASQHNVIAEEIALNEDEVAPTYLINNGFSRIGEDLVHIYDTPSNSDKDPSLWVLASFALFFAIIVSDAGYGLIFILLSLFIQKSKKKSPLGKRIVRLLMLLGISSLSWGLLCHSFFGISFHENQFIKRSSLLTYIVTKKAEFHLSQGTNDSEIQKWSQQHQNRVPKEAKELLYTPNAHGETFEKQYANSALFELSLFIGIFHLILGMVWYIRKQPSHIGWILFLIGAYLYVPIYLDVLSFSTYLFGISQATAAHIGFLFMIWGSIGAIGYGVWKEGISGIFECMVAIQLFADTLSYLRLYALSLSGALVAEIIMSSIQKMPLVIGVFVLVIAHAINIILATVGGIIHGLRLNFLEWYHYAFEGGGKKFTPLCYEEPEKES